MIIEVTQEHIDKGIQNEDFEHPVALALCDAMNLKAVEIRYAGIYGHADFGRFGIDFKPEIVKIIRRYDQTGKMKPFSFPMDIPGARNVD